MAPNPPAWRKAFDAVEGRIAPPVERAVRTDAFADVLAIGIRLQRRLQREAERRTRRALHLVNMPAATDVKRLSAQLTELQRQTRALERRLEDAAPRAQASARTTRRPRATGTRRS